MKYYLVTLGCTKNEFDSSVIESKLLESDFVPTEKLEEAKVIILNTCSFIKEAIEESKEMARYLDMSRRKGAKLIITGCLVNYAGKEIEEELSFADAIVPISKQALIPEILENASGEKKTLIEEEKYSLPAFEHYCTAQEGRPVALLKIAEGCSNFCSYCAIPITRGKLKSISEEVIVREAERLLKHGARELVLVAQDLDNYGMDFSSEEKLSSLVKKLSEVSRKVAGEDYWIRLLYMNPDNLSREMVEKIFNLPGVVPYFDIPVQTGSDRIRKLMGRRKSIEEVCELLSFLREKFKDAHLRTSFLVGYPGENEEDVEATIRFVKQIEFDYAVVFKYSRMPGTRAYWMRNQIPESEKLRRVREVQEIIDEITQLRALEREGLKVKMLVQSVEDGDVTGRYFGQAPEIDGNIYLKESQAGVSTGEFIMVKLIESQGFDYIAEVI